MAARKRLISLWKSMHNGVCVVCIRTRKYLSALRKIMCMEEILSIIPNTQSSAEALPLQAKLQTRKGKDAVPSLKPVRRAFSGKKKGRTGRKGPMQGASAPAVRSYDSLSFRRVIVKTRIIKMTAYGQKAAALHLRYLDREGTSKSQEKEGFFDREHDGIARRELAATLEGEPHQFRFIVSPEDGARLELKSYTRELMGQLETDLNRKLKWQAVNHYNTDNPHTHIVVHGLDQKGEAVFIDREYISNGIRNRAQALATRELGLRMEHEITHSLQRDVQARYFTPLDRQLLKQSDEHRRFQLQPTEGDTPASRIQRARVIGRLTTLQSFGMVEKLGVEHWQLPQDLRQRLQQLNQHEIGLQRLQAAAVKLPHPPNDYRLHASDEVPAIEGVVLDRGLSDEMSDRGYLVIGDQQGSLHHLDVKNLNRIDAHVGHLVAVNSFQQMQKNNSQSQLAESLEPGTPEKKKQQKGRAAYAVQVQHQLPLKAQIVYPGRTYLDQHYHALLNTENPHSIPQRLKQAAKLRSHWLQQQGLEPGTQDSRLALDGMEREALARKVSQQNDLSYRVLARNESFNGKVLQVHATPSQRTYVLVANSREFAMVPWQKERDQQRGIQRGTPQPLQPGMNMAIGINRDGRTWTKALGRGLSR